MCEILYILGDFTQISFYQNETLVDDKSSSVIVLQQKNCRTEQNRLHLAVFFLRWHRIPLLDDSQYFA